MEGMANLAQNLQRIVNNLGVNLELPCSEEKLLKMQCDSLNKMQGNLTGYDCPECKNRGYINAIKDGQIIMKECRCSLIRRSIKNIERSGLKDLLDQYTFESYQVEDGWQRIAVDSAKRFLRDHDGKWFYIGGQVGAGKTHICTAIVGELLNIGLPAKYMLWRDEVTSLKANIMDDVAYGRAMGRLKTVKVLYIDDFFKCKRGSTPTDAEVKIAFEILNSRYNSKNLITIISSELKVQDILSIDEAVGSRIYHRTKEYCLEIPRDKNRNYRLR